MMAPQTVYIREIATVAGFILSTEIKEVSVGYTNTNVEISYENTPNNGKIIIEKVDSANGATLEGAVFGIYSDLACTQLVEKITTGANGKAISSALVPGKYFYRELVAPIGYVIDNTVSSVEVGYTITEVTVTAVNDAQLGKITIYKKGPVLKGFEDGKFIYEDAYLSGVVFGVYDIAGNKLMEIVTVDGIAETPLLKLGKYTIKELNASNGYIMSEQTYEAELVYDAQVVSVDASISVKNDIQRAEIQIKKVSSLDKTPLLIAYSFIILTSSYSTWP